jgi:putative spermidine/putrescine transport system ATP-binding protein
MSESAEPAIVRFEGVQQSYDGRVLVVRDLSLEVARGEFLTLVGPSGSGGVGAHQTERPTRAPCRT